MSGNPLIKKEMELQTLIKDLKMEKARYSEHIYELQDNIRVKIPEKIHLNELIISHLKKDVDTASKAPKVIDEDGKETHPVTIMGTVYNDRKEAGAKLKSLISANAARIADGKDFEIGEYRGFKLSIFFDTLSKHVIYKSSEGLLVLDNSKNVLYYNSIVKHIFPEIAVNKPVDREVTEKCFYENGCINELRTQNTIESNGRIYELKAEPIYEAEYTQGYMVRIFDYTAHYRSMEELRRSVHIDALTGLYDREWFKQEIIRHLSGGGTGALVMSDIDFFKQINDNFGHMIGDEALVTLAEAIRSVFSGHLYCRVGGDEFMMFVKDTNDTDIIGEFAERLNAVFKEKVKNVSEGLDSSLSMGIALSSSISDGTESDEVFEMLYGLADTALYNTKNNGKNGFSFYETMPAR